MKAKELVTAAVLLALGTILHMIVPPLFLGIKPDFLLAMMFVAIIINPNIKNTIAVGVVAGILAALTTGMPGGQIPSIFDKLGSAIIVYAIYKAARIDRDSSNSLMVKAGVLGFLGTLVSGVIFLTGVMMLSGLPGGNSFGHFVYGIVLPTSVANAIIVVIMVRLLVAVMPSQNR